MDRRQLVGFGAAGLLSALGGLGRAEPMRDGERVQVTPDGERVFITDTIVRVPETRNDRDAGSSTLQIAVMRVRRAGAPARHAHVLLAGGPGQSGVDLVAGGLKRGGARFLDVFGGGDVVGVDQRGTGRSLPNLEIDMPYGLPLDQPGSIQAWLPPISRACRAVAADFHTRGVRLDAYNSVESAHDLEEVRKALGYEQVTLWGRSYGSHLALAAARLYPDSVRRLILAGPEGPDHTYKLPSEADAAIARFAVRAGRPELPSLMRRVLQRLEREPALAEVEVGPGRTIPVPLGAFDLQWLAAQAVGDPRTLSTLPSAIDEMDRGDFRRLGRLALLTRRSAGVGSAMKMMMDLSSGASGPRRRRMDDEARTSLLGDALNFPTKYVSEDWPVRDLGEAYRETVRSSVPTLILAGDLDARTPIANGQEIASGLERASLVILENAAHQFDMFGAPDVRAVLAAFLAGERVPDRLTFPVLKAAG